MRRPPLVDQDRDGHKEIVDQWGIPLRVYVTSSDTAVVVSAGADSWFGTDPLRESLSPGRSADLDNLVKVVKLKTEQRSGVLPSGE
jgi:hypothetical protein